MKQVGDGSKKMNERILDMVDTWVDACGAKGRLCKDCGDRKECYWVYGKVVDRIMN